jgi:hypothetical protein
VNEQIWRFSRHAESVKQCFESAVFAPIDVFQVQGKTDREKVVFPKKEPVPGSSSYGTGLCVHGHVET